MFEEDYLTLIKVGTTTVPYFFNVFKFIPFIFFLFLCVFTV